MDVAKSGSEDVASVFEARCKRLFKIFHLLSDVCCKRFDLDVAYIFTHILQVATVVSKYFICFSLLLQQVFSCCKCVYVDVAYVSTHPIQVFYLDIAHVYNGLKRFSVVFSSVSYACFIYF
jgi:hypothetical protein